MKFVLFYEWKRQECPQLADIAWLDNLSCFLKILHYTSMHETRVSKTIAHGPNPSCEAVSSDPRKHFATNEKIYYIYEKLVDLVKWDISQNNHVMNSLCGPQTKKFGNPCNKQTATRCLLGKTAKRMFCDIKTERKFTVGFGKIPWNWAAEIISKSKIVFKKFYNICRQSYKPSRNLRKIFQVCSSCKCEFSKIFLQFCKMETNLRFLAFPDQAKFEELDFSYLYWLDIENPEMVLWEFQKNYIWITNSMTCVKHFWR